MASGLRAWKEQRALGLIPDEDKGRTKLRTRRTSFADKRDKLGQQNDRDNKIADTYTTKRYVVAEKLREILENPHASPQSRAAAGRTLAEMDGMIGRHQRAPDRTAITPINALSRSELEAELQRLRDKLQLTS